MINSRRQAGKRAQSNGKMFETWFERKAYTQGIAISRLPDGCRVVGAGRLMRVKTHFDWIISYAGCTALIDTKTTSHKNFAHADIAEHQVEGLFPHHQHGTITGYVIYFQAHNQVIFVPTDFLRVRRGIRGSIELTTPGVTSLGTLQGMDLKGIFSL